MIASFRERMVGPVREIPRDRAEVVILPPRSEVVGDDIVALARRAIDSGVRGPQAGTSTLDLDRLLLWVDDRTDDRGGYRAAVPSGFVGGLGGAERRPVIVGFADLLHRTRLGERRMYYRLLVAGADGPFVVEGVKVVAGRLTASWRQTTTLYTRVSRIGAGVDVKALAESFDGAVTDALPVAAGILRIRPDDLLAQVVSMRGRVPRFLLGFGRRLAIR